MDWLSSVSLLEIVVALVSLVLFMMYSMRLGCV
jgi:hypothetical protein